MHGIAAPLPPDPQLEAMIAGRDERRKKEKRISRAQIWESERK